MIKHDASILEVIVKAGHAADLHDLLLGKSKYCILPVPRRSPLSKDEQRLYVLAIHYLHFVTQYGLGIKEAQQPAGHYLMSHEQDFKEWIERGAPGVFWDDIDAYLKDNPLSAKSHPGS